MLSIKLDEIFEEFSIEQVKDVFEDFLVGKRKIKFKISIIDISEAFYDRGIRTKKERLKIIEAQKYTDDFYSFQKDLK